LNELNVDESFDLQDIKSRFLTEHQLDELKEKSGSYEALFSKRAQLYKSKGLKDQHLTETDFKNFILEHYTFLKRPVMVFGNEIFIGNSAKTVAAAKSQLSVDE